MLCNHNGIGDCSMPRHRGRSPSNKYRLRSHVSQENLQTAKKERLIWSTIKRNYMPEFNNWVICRFTKDQLDGQRIYFPLPPSNQMFFGQMHVTDNGQGKLQIEITYGGPDSSGVIQSGTWIADQTFATRLQDPSFVVAPPYWYAPAQQGCRL